MKWRLPTHTSAWFTLANGARARSQSVRQTLGQMLRESSKMTRRESDEIRRFGHVVDASPELTETQKRAIMCLLDRIKEIWNRQDMSRTPPERGL